MPSRRDPTRTVQPRTVTSVFRLLSLLGFFLAAGCADRAPPTATTPPDDLPPLLSYYPDAGVLTSSRDTCPWYDEAPELGSLFWESSDSALVPNPDSVFAADSAKVSGEDYWQDLMRLDAYTGAELFAGRCEVEWNRCQAHCRQMPMRTRAQRIARASCWAACAARYALCIRREREREQDETGTGPYSYCPNSTYKAVIYDGGEEPCDPYSGGSGSGGGGDGTGGGGSECRTEWIVVEVNDGTEWRTIWEGYATVCE